MENGSSPPVMMAVLRYCIYMYMHNNYCNCTMVYFVHRMYAVGEVNGLERVRFTSLHPHVHCFILSFLYSCFFFPFFLANVHVHVHVHVYSFVQSHVQNA